MVNGPLGRAADDGRPSPHPRFEPTDATPLVSPDITSTSAFERALEDLLATAIENEVDPSGSWEIRNGDRHPDWEAQIVELEKSS